MNNICIIPARGGSKRIHRKNIKDFLGKPIISYSIEAARYSGLFSEIMVSTEDQEIAAIAEKYQAKVPFLRSSDNANDYASTLDVLREVIRKYEIKGQTFDNYCCLYPTAPFVTVQLLQTSYETFCSGKFDSLFPIMKYSFPIQRSLKKNNEGRISYNFDDTKNVRSQDVMTTYHDAGQFYWLKKAVCNNDSIVTSNTGSIEISELEGQDIDSETDWRLAEMKYELLQSIR